MLAHDRAALSYGIYDMQALPATVLAELAAGLREDSRIKMSLSGMRGSRTELLLAILADRLGLLVWFQTEDGRRGVNRPRSIAEALLAPDSRPEGDVIAFDSARDFEAEWTRRTGVSHG